MFFLSWLINICWTSCAKDSTLKINLFTFSSFLCLNKLLNLVLWLLILNLCDNIWKLTMWFSKALSNSIVFLYFKTWSLFDVRLILFNRLKPLLSMLELFSWIKGFSHFFFLGLFPNWLLTTVIIPITFLTSWSFPFLLLHSNGLFNYGVKKSNLWETLRKLRHRLFLFP